MAKHQQMYQFIFNNNINFYNYSNSLLSLDHLMFLIINLSIVQSERNTINKKVPMMYIIGTVVG
ncbi:hypothetical protein BXP70_07260 [Hymenobacter crusticola]|uniref:Uncharacterized protein n=1 Tax=Hymenobacter crusticola TaxID=1770526 RepID=A0A243WG95_9BACT|nr:hypothetical protein BXP70_07260 [Hymenobacter crusticola]